MRTSLLAASLAAIAAVTSHTAFANTGPIYFSGEINSSTCPIEVVDPGHGGALNPIQMGSVPASRLAASGDQAGGRSFALQVPEGSVCGLTADGTATVTFESQNGAAGNHYAIRAQSGAARNVAIGIKDNAGTFVNHQTASKAYPIKLDAQNELLFSAVYVATGAAAPGIADADIKFLVDIQ